MQAAGAIEPRSPHTTHQASGESSACRVISEILVLTAHANHLAEIERVLGAVVVVCLSSLSELKKLPACIRVRASSSLFT